MGFKLFEEVFVPYFFLKFMLLIGRTLNPHKLQSFRSLAEGFVTFFSPPVPLLVEILTLRCWHCRGRGTLVTRSHPGIFLDDYLSFAVSYLT